jgi:hypothetical protein
MVGARPLQNVNHIETYYGVVMERLVVVSRLGRYHADSFVEARRGKQIDDFGKHAVGSRDVGHRDVCKHGILHIHNYHGINTSMDPSIIHNTSLSD